MVFRTLLMTLAVFGMVFCGCAKKPKQVQRPVQQAPALPETAAAAAQKKIDTGEVFNEYYSSKDKKVGKTFAMHDETSAGSSSFSPEFSEGGSYVVQIAAGPSSEGAEQLANDFKGKGYPAYVAEVQNPTPELAGTYYRVRIGCFGVKADAVAFGENILRPANYDYWVDLKSNDAVGTGSGASSEYSSGGYTPTYTPAASEPAYTPATTTPPAATTTDYSSSGSTPNTTSYDWSTPAPSTPAAAEPAASTPTTTETTPSWTTEPSTTPPPPATETPSSTTSPDTGWGGSWK